MKSCPLGSAELHPEVALEYDINIDRRSEHILLYRTEGEIWAGFRG